MRAAISTRRSLAPCNDWTPQPLRDYLSTLQDLMKNGDKGPPVVMVVDDDADILKTLAAIFREEGFETLVAMNGVEALFLLSQRPRPALIVLDLMMPEMDGIELAERLGSDKQLSTIPLLLFSANDHVAEHARTLGAVGHIAKPADLDKLLGLVHGAIDTSARRRA